jgi:eukaryotic-like serine/threonine-protein kinase
VPLTGEHIAFGVLTNAWNESSAVISPDGKWLAYASDESGRAEIYVQTYPSGGNRRQISTAGAGNPRWSRSGKELFYCSGRKLVAVESVEPDSFIPGKPKVLFEGDFNEHYDVSLDGKELLLNDRAESCRKSSCGSQRSPT